MERGGGYTFESKLARCVEPAGRHSIDPCYAGDIHDSPTFAGTETRESCTDQAMGNQKIGLHLGSSFVISIIKQYYLSANYKKD